MCNKEGGVEMKKVVVIISAVALIFLGLSSEAFCQRHSGGGGNGGGASRGAGYSGGANRGAGYPTAAYRGGGYPGGSIEVAAVPIPLEPTAALVIHSSIPWWRLSRWIL